MHSQQDIIKYAKQALYAQSQAIKQLIPRIDFTFIEVVNKITEVTGRVIVTGMGKPGYIARKFAATLMSTGTPAMYLHPAEAIHGDLGMITATDMIIIISNSGETTEIINLLPTIRKINVPVIAICGNRLSTLGTFANYYLDAHVIKEICPLNLAPTTSTTAQLALSDVLAIAVMRAKNVTCDDFAFYHPGGNLGQMRLLTAKKLIEQTNKNPQIGSNKLIADALFVMTESGVGAVCVMDNNQTLVGVITDGDIRRQLKSDGNNLLNKVIKDVMTLNPTTIHESQYASDAIKLMENHKPNPINILPVINDRRAVIGMIHLTDLLKFNNN